VRTVQAPTQIKPIHSKSMLTDPYLNESTRRGY
jgi:hypothetical protein